MRFAALRTGGGASGTAPTQAGHHGAVAAAAAAFAGPSGIPRGTPPGTRFARAVRKHQQMTRDRANKMKTAVSVTRFIKRTRKLAGARGERDAPAADGGGAAPAPGFAKAFGALRAHRALHVACAGGAPELASLASTLEPDCYNYLLAVCAMRAHDAARARREAPVTHTFFAEHFSRIVGLRVGRHRPAQGPSAPSDRIPVPL